MPVQEEKTKRPWIVFIGLSKVAQPKSMADLHPQWASGCIVGDNHILTAAHVCKNLDLARRIQKLGGRTVSLVCIPGFQGTFTNTTQVYTIQDNAFVVSKHCLHSAIQFREITQYAKALTKVEHRNFYSNDLGMYFLGSKLPAEIPRARVHAETDSYLDPPAKNPLMAHGYPMHEKGRLVFANTHCTKAFPAKFAMHDAMLKGGASGGPLWRLSSRNPTVIGVVSGVDQVNLGGPMRGYGRDSKTGEYGEVIINEETFEMTLLENLDPKPPEPKVVTAGIASRINGQSLLEIEKWLERKPR